MQAGSKVHPERSAVRTKDSLHAVSRACLRLGVKPSQQGQARASGQGCGAQDARSLHSRHQQLCSGRLSQRWDWQALTAVPPQ